MGSFQVTATEANMYLRLRSDKRNQIESCVFISCHKISYEKKCVAARTAIVYKSLSMDATERRICDANEQSSLSHDVIAIDSRQIEINLYSTLYSHSLVFRLAEIFRFHQLERLMADPLVARVKCGETERHISTNHLAKNKEELNKSVINQRPSAINGSFHCSMT